ncbi:DUF427 domain-containing protein [Streptomyces sp. P6-2-1]|uniref:DUF427 domain-containing protein n=1 Tax=unclassified Streptomyces TaxID=2593676 RepID=UPI003D35AAF0
MPKFTSLSWEPSERWVRGVRGSVTVVDSKHPVLVRDPDKYAPLYAFPKEDVRTDLLKPGAAPPDGATDPGKQFYDLHIDGVVVPHAAWSYPESELEEHIAFDWFLRDGVLDHWYEEDEEIFVTPRDPQHRVDALRSSRDVVVRIDGTVVAESNRPVVLFETGHATCFYLPPEDVRMELFTPTDSRTGCPYKGFASYWTFNPEGGGEPRTDVAWSYEDPTGESAAIKGYLCFYTTVAEYIVDGVKV